MLDGYPHTRPQVEFLNSKGLEPDKARNMPRDHCCDCMLQCIPMLGCLHHLWLRTFVTCQLRHECEVVCLGVVKLYGICRLKFESE